MEEKSTEQKKIIEPKRARPDKTRIKLSRIKRKIFKHTLILRTLLLGTLLAGFYFLFILMGNFFESVGVTDFIGLAGDFIFTPDRKIESIEGRTNILILGKGGKNHNAPDLTDTIIFASVSHNGDGINLISLPRDIWIPALRAKLNSIYYWGNQKRDGGGFVLAKATVEEIAGKPVNYGIVIDFSGFREIVDVLGGIEVEVERGFTDEKYPIVGKENDPCGGDLEYKCRYETIEFKKGLQHMDGETALKFVRSRNAEGDEGTDIARAKRQQKIISAIQEKVLNPEVLLSPKKISRLVLVSKKYVETDINQSAASILARRFLQSKDNVKSHVLEEKFLENPPISPKYDNLYVFIPKGGSWKDVHSWIQSLLSE